MFVIGSHKSVVKKLQKKHQVTQYIDIFRSSIQGLGWRWHFLYVYQAWVKDPTDLPMGVKCIVSGKLWGIIW